MTGSVLLFYLTLASGVNGAQLGAQETGFFTYSEGRLTRVEGNPASYALHVSKWQIWLYPKGASTSGDSHWGIISGETAPDVLAQLQAGQAFEKAWEEWCCPYGRSTYFNPLGPIAVLAADPRREIPKDWREDLANSSPR